MKLSTALTSMPRSGVRAIMDLAWSIPGVIHLEVGEPDLDTPAHIIDAAHSAAMAGQTRYAPNAGTPELRTALAAKIADRYLVPTTPKQIVVTNGAVQGLQAAMLACLNPGDAILLPDPGWPNYTMMSIMARVKAQYYTVGTQPSGHIDPEYLAAQCSPATRAILINSPSNPTGMALSEDELAAILSLAEQRDLWIISDECYDEMVFDRGHSSLITMTRHPRLICVFSMSKTYAMTGLRVGYQVADPEVAAGLAKLQESIISCVNTPAQAAALAAVTGPQSFVTELRESLRSRRDDTVALLRANDIGVEPADGGLYAWIDVRPTGLSDVEFAQMLVRDFHVCVVPGVAFGTNGSGYVRASIATERSVLLDGIQRLAKLYQSLL